MTRPSSRRNRAWFGRPGGRVQPGVVGQRGDPVAGKELGGLLHRCPGQAVDDARVPGVLVVRMQVGAIAGSARPWARCGTGCWAGRSWPRTGGPRSGPAGSTISVAGGLGRGGGQRDRAAPRASARAARTARGSRAGSRAPTGIRSAPRRWRTARSCPGPAGAAWRRCAAAPAPGRAGPARRRGSRLRPGGAGAESWVELRNPARTPSAAQRVHLVLHQRDQRRDDHAGARAGPARVSGSTATCRRRSASAPARRRPPMR